MDKSLLSEIRGRSLKLFAYAFENKTQEDIDAKLVAFHAKAEREGLSPKQREIQMKAIVDKGMKSSLPGLLTATAKDMLSNLKLIDKHKD